MRKFKSQKGFTLAELLIVVAIIAVLTAIAIPVFNSQMNSARLAADHAMIREAYSLMQYAKITEEITVDGTAKTLSSFITSFPPTLCLYFTKGGSLSTSNSDAYKLQETDTACSQLPKIPDFGYYNEGHQKDAYIMICIYGTPESPQLSMIGIPY